MKGSRSRFSWGRRAAAMAVAVSMVLGILPAGKGLDGLFSGLFSRTAQTARADEELAPIYYKVKGETKVCTDYHVLENGFDNYTFFPNTWQVVTSDATINGFLYFQENSHLILCEGATLTVKGGILLYDAFGVTSELNIYAGSTTSNVGDGGALVAEIEEADNEVAGIGGTAQFGTGIVRIYGGTIIAKGGPNSAGIGAANGGNGGTVEIYGGEVTALAGEGAAGIGGGKNGDGGTIKIFGGRVAAVKISEENLNGIGAGVGGSDADITLSWTSADDLIYAGAYRGTVTLLRDFVDTSDYNDNRLFEKGVYEDPSSFDGRQLTPRYDYTISFDAGGGSGEIPFIVAERGEEITLPECSFTAPGDSEFRYWAVDGSGDVQIMKPGDVFTAEANTTVTAIWLPNIRSWAALNTAISEASSGDTITLTQDLYALSDDTRLSVSGKSITIDLNGHTLDRDLTNPEDKGQVFYISSGAGLTITDGKGSGSITGGYAVNGGAIYNAGTLTIEGGSITGNHASNSGGGIFNAGTLHLNGGVIMGNMADAGYHGGGIHQHNDSANLTISGKPIVMGNTRDGVTNNLGLYAGAKFSVSNLEEGAMIGVNCSEAGSAAYYAGVISYGKFYAKDAKYFVSDTDTLAVGIDDENNAVLTTARIISFNAGNVGATGEMEQVRIADGMSYELPDCAFTAPTGWTFTGWTIGSEIKEAGTSISVSSDMTLTATWEWTGQEMTWAYLQTLINNSEDYAVITLSSDVVAGENDVPLKIPSSKDLSINLNGHTISRNLTEPKENGGVFVVEGSLELKGEGQITGGNTKSTGGGIWVKSGGTVTIKDVTICGNTAKNGGGVYVAGNNSTLILNGGTISNNSATVNGGGINIADKGCFRVYDGEISGNTAGKNGGGIWFGGNSLMMEKGSITANSAGSQGGGVYINVSNVCTFVEGTISGNTASSSGNEIASKVGFNNVYFGVNVDESIVNGSVDLNMQTNVAVFGQAVDLIVTPDTGCELTSITVMAGETAISVTETDTEGVYSFTMPLSPVTVSATFRHIPTEPTQGTRNSYFYVWNGIEHGSVSAKSSDNTIVIPQSAGGSVYDCFQNKTGAREFELSADPDEGYVLKEYIIESVDSDGVPNDEYMIPVQVRNGSDYYFISNRYSKAGLTFRIRAVFVPGVREYSFEINDLSSGDPVFAGDTLTLSVDGTTIEDTTVVHAGDLVTVTVNLQAGHILGSYTTGTYNAQRTFDYPRISYYPSEGTGTKDIELTPMGGNVYTFTIPDDIQYETPILFVYVDYEVGTYDITVEESPSAVETGSTISVKDIYGEEKTNGQIGDVVTVDLVVLNGTTPDLYVYYVDNNGENQKIECSDPVVKARTPYAEYTTYSYSFTMPGQDVYINAEFTENGHAIAKEATGYGGDEDYKPFIGVKVDGTIVRRASAGEVVTVTVEKNPQTASGPLFYGVLDVYYTYTNTDGEEVRGELTPLSGSSSVIDTYREAQGTFVMPDQDVTIHVEMTRMYLIYKTGFTTCDASVSPSGAYTLAGDDVVITVTPKAGVDPDFFTVATFRQSVSGVNATCENKGNGVWTISFTMPDQNVTVFADYEICYVKKTWDIAKKTVTSETKICEAPIPLSTLEGNTLSAGWYILDKDFTANERLEISGDVKLILGDGRTMTCSKGIHLVENNRLTIYGQTLGTGTLVATGKDYCAGIGTDDQDSEGNDHGGVLIIHGGVIQATGGTDAAGIGGGNEADGCSISIYDGTVTATGGDYGAGIGTGDEPESDTYGTQVINIYGGTVTAQGGDEGAGIGGGNEGKLSGAVYIYGGKVDSTGGDYGAGIGGGDEEGQGAAVYISGGNVTAIGGKRSAGIGGGDGFALGYYDTDGGTVVISGGVVYAKGNTGGAGIGAGLDGDGGDVTITGGTITVEAALGKISTDVHTGEDKKAQACPIGGSDVGDETGTLNIGPNMRVYTDKGPVSAAEREGILRGKNKDDKVYVEVCSHPVSSYSITNTTHTRLCACCYTSFSANPHNHNGMGGKCSVCGYKDATYTVTLGAGEGEGLVQVVSVVPDSNFTLPDCDFTAPEGKIFKEWLVMVGFEDTVTMQPGESFAVTGNTVVMAQWQNVYDVIIDDVNMVNGSVSAKSTAIEGESVVLTVTPDDGYTLDTLTVENQSTHENIPVTDNTFVMPPSAVKVSATFISTQGEPEFATKAVVLSGKIGLIFYLDKGALEGEALAASYMSYDISGKGKCTAWEETSSVTRFNEDGYLGFTCFVNSIQMADTVTATFHYTWGGQEKSISMEMSVREYVNDFDKMVKDKQKNGEPLPSQETIDLVHALADYGHYAQLFLSDYRSWKLGTDYAAMNTWYAGKDSGAYSAETVSAVKSSAANNELMQSSSSIYVEEVTMSLLLESETAINLYFTPNTEYASDFTAKVKAMGEGNQTYELAPGETVSINEWVTAKFEKRKDGRYLVSISGICAQDLDDLYLVSLIAEPTDLVGGVVGADATTMSVSASALSYVDLMMNSFTADSEADVRGRNCACAIYKYYEAAKAYRDTQAGA